MKTVAVTTSSDRATAAAIPFTFLGMQPTLLPCISVESAGESTLAAARTAAQDADLLVVSSPRTIDILWPDGSLPDVEFAVVGPSSSRAVQDRGGRVAITGTRGSAQLAEILAPLVGDKHVVWPHADGADPAPLLKLSSSAARFKAQTIYTSVPIAPFPDPVDVISFASPSAVTGWQITRSLAEAAIAVIGATTRQAVIGAGATVAIVAPDPTFQSLAQAVSEYLGAAS